MSRVILVILALLVLGNSIAIYELKSELTQIKTQIKTKEQK